MGSQGFPHGQNLACTFLPYPQRFLYSQRTPILINLSSFKHLLGVIKVHNPINREPYSSFKGVYEPSEALVYIYMYIYIPLYPFKRSAPPSFNWRPYYKGFARLIHSFKGTIGLPINGIMHFYDPQKMLKTA